MPKTNGISRDIANTTLAYVDLFNLWTNQSMNTYDNVVYNQVTTTSDIIVGGNLTVNGGSTIVNSTIVNIEDNIILLNSGETHAGVNLNLAGIEIDRGTLPDYQAVFQESTKFFKIGFINNLQAVATRDDYPLDKGIIIYDATSTKFVSTTNIQLPITFSAGVNPTNSSNGTIIISNGGGLSVTGDTYSDGGLYFKGSNYSSFLKADSSNNLIANAGTNFVFQQTANSQIKIPSQVYLTFNSPYQTIFCDNIDLNIQNSTANINFITAPSGSVTLPINTYLQWDPANRIVYNGTDIVLDSSNKFVINPVFKSTNTAASTNTTTAAMLLVGGLSINNPVDAVASSAGGNITLAGGLAVGKKAFIGNQLVISDQSINGSQVAGQGVNFRSLSRTLTTSINADTAFNTFEGGVINLSAGTILNSSTVFINNAPSIIGGGSLTSAWALVVNSGSSKFNGQIISNFATASTNVNNGGLIMAGGLSISNTSNATSSVSGGGATLNGGAAIGKKLFIGDQLVLSDQPISTVQIPMQGINFRSLNRTVVTSNSNDLTMNSFEGGSINSSAIISNASTVSISGPPSITGTGSISNNYALWVQNGITRLDGMIWVSNTTPSTSPSTGAITLQGGVGISNATDAMSENNGGSITAAGGLAVKKKIFSGSQIISNAGTGNYYFELFNNSLPRIALGLTGSDIGLNAGSNFIVTRFNDSGTLIDNPVFIERSTANITLSSSSASSSSSAGALIMAGGISISNTTNATSLSSGGTLTSLGGASISKDVYIGGSNFVTGGLSVTGSSNLSQTTINTATGALSVSGNNGVNIVVGNASVFRTTTGSISLISDASTVNVNANSGITMNANAGILINGAGTSNFTTSTGMLTLSGIGLNINSNTSDLDLTSSAGVNVNALNAININTTDTTNGIKIGTASASVPVVIGNPNSQVIIQDNLTIGGTLTVLGSTTSIESNVTTVIDNALVVNALPTGLSDGGYLVRRYQTPNNTATGRVITDTPRETGSFQTGSALPGSLVLGSGANSVDNYYTGWFILVTSGSGINQVRRIKSYIGSTKTATLYITSDNNSTNEQDGLDLVTAPVLGDTYSLFDFVYASLYYSELNHELRVAGIPFDVSSGTFPDPPSNYISIHVGSLTIENSFTSNASFTNNGKFTVNSTDIQALSVNKYGGNGSVFTIDTVNSIIKIENPVNTIGSSIPLVFNQTDTTNAVQTYSEINSTITNNVAGNLRNNLDFKVQKDISGLTTFLTLSGAVSGSSYADFSTSVDAVRILNPTASTNAMSGALRLAGGLSISNTTDATSVNSGGTFTTSGGASIAKKLFVGDAIIATGTTQVGTSINSLTGVEGILNIQGDLTLYNPTKNTIVFGNVGNASPTFGTRSSGSKLVLNPSIGVSTTDYAIGTEASGLWLSTADTTGSFKFYLGTTSEVEINNSGLRVNNDNTGLSFYNGATAKIYQSGNDLRFVPNSSSTTDGFIFRDSTDTYSRFSVNSDGKVNIGLSNYSGTPSGSGALLNINPITFTDTSTASNSTTSNVIFNKIGQNTLTAVNTLVTTSSVANVYIDGAPIQGSNEAITNLFNVYIAQGNNVSTGGTITNGTSLYIQGAPTGSTITNAYSLWIASGINRFDGSIIITDQTQLGASASTLTGTEGALNVKGDLTLFNSTKNTIVFNGVGVGSPSFTSRSTGTKIVLNPGIASNSADNAIGVEAGNVWFSTNTSSIGYKFYLGTSNRFQIDNTGLLLDSASNSTAVVFRINSSSGTDNKGVIINSNSSTSVSASRGSGLALYGNQLNNGDAVLSAGQSGTVRLQYSSNNDGLTISSTGQTIITASTDTTGTNSGALVVNGGANIQKSLFLGSTLTLNFTQPYQFTSSSDGALNIQSLTTGSNNIERHFTFDGNNTDQNAIELYSLGTPGNITNSEYLRISYESSAYYLKTQATGTGSVRNLILQTGSNSNQIQLLSGGQVSMNSTEATTNSSTGALRLAGGLLITNTTNATSSTNGGSLYTLGGAAITQDLYVGGNLNVAGSVQIGVSTPSITISSPVNITGSVTVATNKLLSNGNERILSLVFRFTPTASQIPTSFNFTVPSITSFVNIYDIIITINGYRNDTTPVNIENQFGYAITGTNTAKIQLTSGGIDIHTVQIVCRYTSN